MDFKHRLSLIFISALFCYSCSSCGDLSQVNHSPPSNSKTNTNEDPIQSIKSPPNVVKVLNRVTCYTNRSLCNQEQINSVWNKCIEGGYTVQAPSKEVMSSRSISELVTAIYTYSQENYGSIQSTDSNGIVYQVPSKTKEIKSMTINGYCIGNEYILK